MRPSKNSCVDTFQGPVGWADRRGGKVSKRGSNGQLRRVGVIDFELKYRKILMSSTGFSLHGAETTNQLLPGCRPKMQPYQFLKVA